MLFIKINVNQSENDTVGKMLNCSLTKQVGRKFPLDFKG